MVDGINLLNASSPLQAANSTGLQPHVNSEQVDFHDNLRQVFDDVTSKLREIPGMQGVFCIQPPSQIDITVVDPQAIV